ncbi:MAG: tight adherence protein [Actinomycetota bacterium]|nr:tight adherence protein [Actinomycetota bacterium]
MLPAALVAFFAGLTPLVLVALGVLTRRTRPDERLRRRLAGYPAGATGTPPAAGGRREVPAGSAGRVLGAGPVTRPAVELAERIVARRALDTVMAGHLESAAVPLRTAEWMLLHVACGVAGGLVLLLLSRGALPATVLGLVGGLSGPWAFLVVRRGRRQAAFLARLPDTLQLLASSLKAGYSLPQAIDTVVRQGEPPVAAEFQRALVENRLGIPVEDALERVGTRLRSDDFSWVVMAIRIQHDVGGNLAELLTTVAETLRERERLRRQVRVLSAEGRLSGVILGMLPVGFAAYLVVAEPGYLRPMTTPPGMLLLALAGVLLAVGTLWVARTVRVEV